MYCVDSSSLTVPVLAKQSIMLRNKTLVEKDSKKTRIIELIIRVFAAILAPVRILGLSKLTNLGMLV